MTSIKDVAKAAGLSTATVSRIINENPLVTPETRDRVLKIMREMNYVPNSMARGLSNSTSYTVALLVDIEDTKSFNNPFFYEVMHGIETIVYSKGFCLIIANQQTTSMKKDDMLEWLIRGKRTQGVIIPSAIVNAQNVKELKKLGFPFVVIGEPYSTNELIDWVDINNHQGGGQAVEHLLEHGYERIAFVSGSQKMTFNRNRLAGYKDALRAHGIEVRSEFVREGSGSVEDGTRLMEGLLALAERPDAVICGDNVLSFGAMKAIRAAGLSIPDDLGIVGFDNYPIADLFEPALTTVDIDVFELGKQAANILFRLIEYPESKKQQSLISTDIQARASTKRSARPNTDA